MYMPRRTAFRGRGTQIGCEEVEERQRTSRPPAFRGRTPTSEKTDTSKGKRKEKRFVRDFFEKCTFHGLFDIYSSKNRCMQLFWAFAFVGAIGACAYGCAAVFMYYASTPLGVSYIVQEYSNELQRPARLPDVVICPFNRFNSTYMASMNISRSLVDYIEMAFGFAGKLYRFQQTDADHMFIDDAKETELQRLLVNTNMSFIDLVRKASIRCEALVPYCVTSGGTTECCKTAQAVMTSFGQCYRFNGIRQSAAGYGFGLTLFITIPMDIFSPAINNLHNRGIAVKLVERNQGLDYDLLFFSSGIHAILPIKATRFEFINNPPQYECLELQKAPRNYSRVRCFAECIFEAAHAKCGCSHVASELSYLPACTTSQLLGCMLKTTRDEMQKIPDKVQRCQQKCKPLCEYWQYGTAASYSNIPSETIRPFLRRAAEFEEMSNSIILDVFYERLEYRLIKHFPTKTADTFIANLGGQFGLWLGGSVLTLLQVIVCGIQYAMQRVARLRREQGEERLRRRRISSDCLIEYLKERSMRMRETAAAPPGGPTPILTNPGGVSRSREGSRKKKVSINQSIKSLMFCAASLL